MHRSRKRNQVVAAAGIIRKVQLFQLVPVAAKLRKVSWLSLIPEACLLLSLLSAINALWIESSLPQSRFLTISYLQKLLLRELEKEVLINFFLAEHRHANAF